MLAEKQETLRLTAVGGTAVSTETFERPGLAAAATYQRAMPRAAVLGADGAVVAAAVLASDGSRALAAAAVLTFLAVGWASQLYRRRTALEAQGVVWYLRLLVLPLLATGLVLALAGQDGPDTLLAPLAAAGLALISLRGLAWVFVAAARRQREGLEGALLVGPPARTEQVARRIDAFPEAGLRVAATYDTANTNGQRSRAKALLSDGDVSHILVVGDHDETALSDCVSWTNGVAVDLGIVLPTGTAAGHRAHIGDLGVVPLGPTAGDHRLLWLKRAFDIAASAALLLVLAPVLLIVSAAIYLYDRGPVVYRQRRVGLDNREFTIWKFRSMVPGADKMNDRYANSNVATGLLFKVPDDPRVTPVGNLIRRLSIDELPQLFNVLVGDMSLVGPRPLPVSPDEFDAVARRRHRLRPGITGPWQVEGGHALGYDDMIKLDLAYVDGWSMRRDLWLLLMTVPTVLGRRVAY